MRHYGYGENPLPSNRIRLSMIRKLKSGEYRLYSRKKDESTGKRRNLGTFSSMEKAKQHEREVPDERGRQVVQNAVVGERIDPLEPEVVPDEDAALHEQRPVEVRRRVARRGAEREDRNRDGERYATCERRLDARPPERAQRQREGAHRFSR